MMRHITITLLLLTAEVLWAPGAHAFLAHTRTPIQIPMSDVNPKTSETSQLAADLYLPETGSGPWPVIFIQTPYLKQSFYLVILGEHADDPLFNTLDYAFVVMDWRGFGVSGSQTMNYSGSPSTGEDGYDAVEWIAQQTWCTGRIGTWGASALGNVQMKTAAQRPPHLAACVPIVHHFRETYELTYPGGVYSRNRGEFVGAYFGLSALYKANPLKNLLWDIAESSSGDPSAIDVPMLHISGWYDHEPASTIGEFRAVQSAGGPSAAGHQKLLIGPWSHGRIGDLVQNELEYPAALFEDSIETLRFFDYYLRDIDNGWPERSPVRAFQTNEDFWLDDQDWPPADTSWQTLYLNDAGHLTADPPQATALNYLIESDPSSPVLSLCGALLNSGEGEQGPGDLSPLMDRPEVLFLSTAPLPGPMRIAGDPTAEIHISCNQVDADVNLRLAQVYPDGRWMWLADGVRRASLRNGFRLTDKSLLTPGTVYRIPVDFPPLAATIPAGHRLGLLVTPSNYDMFDVNMHDGSNLSDDPDAVPTPATIHLHVSPQYSSRIMLPLRAFGDAQVGSWSIYDAD